MKNYRIIGMSVVFLGVIVPSAIAETVPTMDQPDNGFYETADPEWAHLHSTDVRGTIEHRQYHRDAIKAHFLWLEQHKSGQGTDAYNTAHRLFHKERNNLHREFHTSPVIRENAEDSSASTMHEMYFTRSIPSLITSTEVISHQLSGERPSRRSIIAAAEQKNTMRAILR